MLDTRSHYLCYSMVMRMEKPQQSAQLPETFDSHTAQVEKLNDLHKLLRFLLENDLGLSTRRRPIYRNIFKKHLHRSNPFALLQPSNHTTPSLLVPLSPTQMLLLFLILQL